MRYKRQIALPEIGINGQEKIACARVLCVGAGGLGSPALLYLAAAGIGHIGIIEFDRVDESNLQRQVLFTTDGVGQPKAVQAKERLNALNPEIEITIYEDELNAENAADLFQTYDIILDGTDNFETKFLINDLGLKYNIPFTIAGIQGFEGQLISVDPHKTACYRCIFHEIPKTDKSKPIPVISPICGVMGSLQANEILKGLLNIGQRTVNKVMLVSLFYGDFIRTPIKLNPRCICQQK